MTASRAPVGDAPMLRPPASDEERVALLGFEQLERRYAGDGQPWPSGRAAVTTSRGVAGVDRRGMATTIGISEPVVDDLEAGRIHPALIPAGYVELAPWLPWIRVVDGALRLELPPIFSGADNTWPAGTAARWLAERGQLRDPAPMRHPASGGARGRYRVEH